MVIDTQFDWSILFMESLILRACILLDIGILGKSALSCIVLGYACPDSAEDHQLLIITCHVTLAFKAVYI